MERIMTNQIKPGITAEELKAESLMIGNYLQNHVFEWVRVNAILDTPHNIKTDAGTFMVRGLSGIPLTPEILERCGFEKWDWHDGYIIPFMGKHLMIREYQGKILTRTLSVIRDSKGHLGKNSKEFLPPNRLKFVHQLQNLYYSLTGTHLTINPVH